jgi:phosphoglycerol transferase MdoB-like AlkP superfamily enzyme
MKCRLRGIFCKIRIKSGWEPVVNPKKLLLHPHAEIRKMHANKFKSNVFAWLTSLFCFWLLVFFMQRQIFLLFHLKEVSVLPWKEVLLSNGHGLIMDLSFAAYLVTIPFLIAVIMLFAGKQRFPMTAIHMINVILLFITILTGIADIALSVQWGTKTTSMALSFVDTSREFASLVFSFSNLGLFLLLALLFIAFLYIYHLVFRKTALKVKSRMLLLPTTLLCFGLLLLAARGGWGKMPLDRSCVHYSLHPVLNNAALNGDWNLSEILVKPSKKTNPYEFFRAEKAAELREKLFQNPRDSTISILTIRHPNIVLIIMESMGADVFSCLGGEKGIAPGLDSLANEGLLFTNIYAAGFRTDQGLLALFSGYPAIPQQPVIRDFERIEHLPHMCRDLNKAGYHTSYLLGGTLDYANTRTYMLTGGTQQLVDADDFPVIKKTSWGAYDEEVFAEHLKLARSFPQPFFSAISTLTNHEEFNAKVPRVFQVKSIIDDFRNTAHYTDRCIVNYLRKAATQPWFKNTLFVIVADHAHTYPRQRQYNEPGRHHIPLLFYGDVLKQEFKGLKIPRTGAQYDLPCTLLKQIGIAPVEYTWGKDLMARGVPEFAWYSFDNGFGFITAGGYVVYDHNQKRLVQQENTLDPGNVAYMTNEGKAFLQVLYRDYLDLARKMSHKAQ